MRPASATHLFSHCVILMAWRSKQLIVCVASNCPAKRYTVRRWFKPATLQLFAVTLAYTNIPAAVAFQAMPDIFVQIRRVGITA